MTLSTLDAQHYCEELSIEVSLYKTYKSCIFPQRVWKESRALEWYYNGSELTWNSRRSFPFVQEMIGRFKRCVCTFNFPQCLIQPLAFERSRKRYRIRCAENLSLSFISFFKLSHARISQYCVTCTCYDVSIWFLPRCNFSLLCTVQTECLTRPVNSSPHVALSAW